MAILTGNEAPAPVIEALALSKTFRDFWRRPKVRAVAGLSFAVRPGEVFGLLGPNGSGKSTTLKMILGLLHPSRGRLRVLGHDPRHVRTKERIGYLPEESHLYPYLTGGETLDFYGRLFDLSDRERAARTAQLLEMIGLLHARDRMVGEYSKGMARRIGLAQALLNDPDLVVLDEPTSGLDPLGCRQVKDLIRMLAQRGKTVLLSSHLLADIEDICDRVAILCNGRLQAQGTLADLLEERGRFLIELPQSARPEDAARLEAWWHEQSEAPLAVRHPRRNLEDFFIETVEQARTGTEAPTGATAAGPPADYLQTLARPPAPPAPAPTTPPVATAAAPQPEQAARLRALAKAETASEPAEPPAPSAPPPADDADLNRKLASLVRK